MTLIPTPGVGHVALDNPGIEPERLELAPAVAASEESPFIWLGLQVDLIRALQSRFVEDHSITSEQEAFQASLGFMKGLSRVG